MSDPEARIGNVVAARDRAEETAAPPPKPPDPYRPLQEEVARLPVQHDTGAEEKVRLNTQQETWRAASDVGHGAPNNEYMRSVNNSLDTLVTHVPELTRYPDIALSLAGQMGRQLADPIGAAQSFDTLSRGKELMELVQRENPGIWGILGQLPGDIGSAGEDAFHALQGAAKGTHGGGQQEMQQGVGGLIGGAASAAGNTVGALERIPAIGQAVHDYLQFQADQVRDIGDALHNVSRFGDIGRGSGDIAGGTIGAFAGEQAGNRAFTDVRNAVNSGFDFLQHQYRLFSEVQREHGDAAAVAAAMPGLIAMALAAGATAVGGPEGGSEVGAEVAPEFVAEEAAANAGEEVATGAVADAMRAEATNVARRTIDYWRSFNKLGLGTGSRLVGQSVETVARSLGLPVRAVTALQKAAMSPEVFAGEWTQYAADKTMFAKQWKETADGAEWGSKYGRPDTIGGFITQSMPPGLAKEAIQNIANFTTYFGLADPFAAWGHLSADAKSAEGLGGLLSKIAPGTSFESARSLYDSIPLAFGRNQWRSAVDYMAEHDAGDIATWNPKLAEVAARIDDLKVRGEDGELNKAATADKIIQFFVDRDNARLFTQSSTLPLRGFGSFIREVGGQVPGLRAFEKLPMFIEDTHVQNREAAYGDARSVPAIVRSLKQSGIGESTAKEIGNQLLHANDPREWRQALNNAWTGAYQTRTWKYLGNAVKNGMPESVAREYNALFEAAIQHKVDEIIGTFNGDRAGNYGVGPDGENISRVVRYGPTGELQFSGSAALYTEQADKFLLPNYHQIDLEARRMVTDFTKMVKKSATLRDGTRFWRRGENWTFANLNGAKEWIDFNVNGRLFKPLALATGGWAFRVSASEVFLNMYRQGMFRTFASHWAGGAGEKESRLLGYVAAIQRGKGGDKVVEALAQDSAEFAASYLRRNDIPLPEPREMMHLSAALYSARLGFDRGIVKSLGQEALLDTAMAAIVLNDGHIAPFGVLSNHSGAYIDLPSTAHWTDQMVKERQEAAGRTTELKVERARLSKSGRYQEYQPDEPGFTGFRLARAQFLARSKWGRPLVTEYLRAMEETSDPAQAFTATEQEALRLIDEEGDGIHLMERSRSTSLRDSTGVPRLDHARDLAKDVAGFLLGPQHDGAFLEASGLVDNPDVYEGRYFDRKGAEKIRDDQVPGSVQHWHDWVHGELPDIAFNRTVGPVVNDFSAAMPRWSIRQTADFVQNHVLGKMVNNLSREATFLLDFHDERQLLAPLVEDGRMDQAQADTQAMQRAVNKMIRFIHNPVDKTKYDEMLRVIAPFYFAKMQAWRRVGRLLATDPGAFEQYIKLMLGITRGVAQVGRGGAAFFTLPFSFWGLKMQGSLDSLQSVNPVPYTEDQGQSASSKSWDQLLQMISPNAGPVATIPTAMLEQLAVRYGWVDPTDDKRIGDALLGPVGNQMPLWTAFVPNSVLQHMIEGVAGTEHLYTDWRVGPLDFGSLASSFVSAQDAVLEVKFTEALRKAYNESKTATPQAGSLDAYLIEHGDMNLDEFRLQTAIQSIISKWDNPDYQAQVINDANAKTGWAWALKTGFGAISPVSLSFAQDYPKIQQYYNTLIQKHGIIKADDMLIKRFPWAMALTVSHHAGPGANTDVAGYQFPTTLPGLRFYEDHRYMSTKYPTAAAVLAAGTGYGSPYDQWAAGQTSILGLRQTKAPSQFMQDMEYALGDAYVHNVLYPAYDKLDQKIVAGGGNDYTLYEAWWGASKRSIVNQFGMNDAANWWAYYKADGAASKRQEAISQFETMAADPQFQSDSPTDIAIRIAGWIGTYSRKIPFAESTKDGGIGYQPTVNAWNDMLNQFAAGKFPKEWDITGSLAKAVAQQLSYAITVVYRPLAARHTGG